MRARLPKNPKLIEIRVEDYVDTDKEDALRVAVILDEDVDVENVNGREISDLMSAIRARIRELGVELWAYIFFAKPSELEEDDGEE